MKRLTKKDDWAGDYRGEVGAVEAVETFHRANKNIREMWDSALLPLLRVGSPASALEIGSAPGGNLIEAWKMLGAIPVGIEYTESGAELNRQVFRHYGLDPNNVICDDFFSPTLDHLKDKFDLVMSFGFVEHFADTFSVISRQISFCRAGGHVVITIPRLRGLYAAWNNAFDPRVAATHNMSLMRDEVFFRVCESVPGFAIKFRGAVGSFEYGLLTHRGQFLARVGIASLRRLAPVLQFLDRRLLSKIGLGHAPYLVVVGERTG